MVLFVVDRKDLDYQTMKEYDRFQKDAANSNKSVAILTKQLEAPPKIAGRYTLSLLMKLTLLNLHQSIPALSL